MTSDAEEKVPDRAASWLKIWVRDCRGLDRAGILGSVSQDNVEIVMRLHAAFSRGDLEGLLAECQRCDLPRRDYAGCRG